MATIGRIDCTPDLEKFEKLIRSADSLLAGLMKEVKVAAEAGDTVVFEHTVSDMQQGVEVVGDCIYGTLLYTAEGALPAVWGAGYFLTLKFSDPDENASTVKVGLDPSVSSGMAALDQDMNAVFKVTDKSTQKLKVVSETSDGTRKTIQTFDLSGLVYAPID